MEASIAESKGTTKRKRGELWFIDPLNPYERKRLDGWPVGLKNVGNTCWFSAVIQVSHCIISFETDNLYLNLDLHVGVGNCLGNSKILTFKIYIHIINEKLIS